MDNRSNVNNCNFMSCEKLDRVANWVGTNVASAFFASLERCSCINLETKDFEDDEEANNRPLITANPASHEIPDSLSTAVGTAAAEGHKVAV